MEAVALSVTGGLIRIAVGVGGAEAISRIRADFAAIVSVDVIAIAILFSVAVGLFFGIYPAYPRKPTNPIGALRYE